MIYVHLVGHDFEYEVRELIKVFYFNKEIVFIDDLNEYNDDILIINRLYNRINELKSITEIYVGSILIYENALDIDKIVIGETDIGKKIKIGIKQNLYDALNIFTDTKAPWGILTGVRPLKIIHKLLDKEYSEKVIFEMLKDEYRLYNDKASLILGIAKKQRKYLYPLDEKQFSLYIAIPFCPSRCLYCSFPACSVAKFGHLIDSYTDKLIYELDRMGEIMAYRTISTVYIGGGTPTAIPTRNLERIIQAVYRNFRKENIQEFTVEAGRPDTINTEMLNMLKENEVNRISINPQTMNDSTLKIIGRNHSSEDIIKIYKLAKSMGFSVINMDLIIGLPSEGIDEIRSTLHKIKELNPENFTVHTLAVKRHSKFRRVMDRYKIEEQNVIHGMLDETRLFADDMELEPYYLYRQKQILGNLENVGYAKKGSECIYNIKMMEEKETIIAVGMGAVSKIYYPKEDRIERVPNVRSLEEYINRVEEMIERKKHFLS